MKNKKKNKPPAKKSSKQARPEIIKFTNEMIWLFNNHPGFPKVIRASCFDSDIKFKLRRLFRRIMESPEVKEYQGFMDDLIETYGKVPNEDKGGRKSIRLDHPKVRDFFALDSGLEVERLHIKTKVLPENLSPLEMMEIEWLIYLDEIEDKRKGEGGK